MEAEMAFRVKSLLDMKMTIQREQSREESHKIKKYKTHCFKYNKFKINSEHSFLHLPEVINKRNHFKPEISRSSKYDEAAVRVKTEPIWDTEVANNISFTQLVNGANYLRESFMASDRETTKEIGDSVQVKTEQDVEYSDETKLVPGTNVDNTQIQIESVFETMSGGLSFNQQICVVEPMSEYFIKKEENKTKSLPYIKTANLHCSGLNSVIIKQKSAIINYGITVNQESAIVNCARPDGITVKQESAIVNHPRSDNVTITQKPVSNTEDVHMENEFVLEIDIASETLDGDNDVAGKCEYLVTEVMKEDTLSDNDTTGNCRYLVTGMVKEEDDIAEEEKNLPSEELILPIQFGMTSQQLKFQKVLYGKVTKSKITCQSSVCGVCGVHFTSSSLCLEHMQKYHTSGNSLFPCAQCRQFFSRVEELKQHEKTHNYKKNNSSKYECNVCDEKFANWSRLSCHIRIHTENKAYRCPDCDKVFTHIHTLTKHKMLHSLRRAHKCGQCGASFHRPEYLKHHMRIHTGERPYVCGECGRSFSNSSNLSAHHRTHTGEKPYKCPHCLAAFTTSSALTVHKWRHTDAKPFHCEQCDQSFTTANTYKRHMVCHTGKKDFKCPQCHKAFTQTSSLTIHLRSHTGERPFFCTQCGATFAQSAHLTVHVRTHTGEKPFVCKDCPKSFPRSEYLLKHQRRVHNVKSLKEQ